MRIRILVTVLILTAIGCDSSDFSVLDNKIVVELTLVSGEPLPSARVSTLSPTDESGNFEDLAVSSAEVILRTGSAELRMPPIPDKPGSYEYLGPEHIVQPGARYDLQIRVPDVQTVITGTTNVPTAVKILSASRESGTYLSDEQLTLILTPGRGTDQSQSNFTLVTQALDFEDATAVPSVSGALEDDEDLTLEDFRISGSPIITEGNFTRFPNGTIELVYPWIGVSFYGRNIIFVNALDENLSGFVRSAELQQGGAGTFGPGEIPNVIPSLSGAHGVFGSLARDSVPFTVFRPAEE